MHRSTRPRASPRWWIVALALATASPGVLPAHNPHDPVDVLAISPAFALDSTLFTAQVGADGWRRQDPLVSRDGGLSWSQMPTGMVTDSPFTSASVSPNFSRDATLAYSTLEEGLFVSTDGGASWFLANGDLPSRALATAGMAVGEDGIRVLFAAPASGGLYRSRDLGETWREVVPPTRRLRALSLSPRFDVEPELLVALDRDQLVYCTEAGNRCTDLGTIPRSGQVDEVLLLPAAVGPTLLVAAEGGLFRREGPEGGFELLAGGLPEETITAVAGSPDFERDGTLFAATASQGVFKSVDRGETWVHHDTGLALAGQTSVHYRLLRVSPQYATDGTLYLGAFEGLLRSVDGGETWRELETRPPSLVTGVALSPSFSGDGLMAASTYGGGAYVSDDTGTSWRPANFGLGSSSLYDVAFAPDPASPPVLFSVHRNHLVRSIDAGASWRQLNITSGSNLFPTAIAVARDSGSGLVVFVGTRKQGVHRSLDAGTSWQWTAAGRIASLVVSPSFASDGTAFCSTWNGRVQRTLDGGDTWHGVSSPLPETDSFVWLAISPDYETDQRILAGTAAGLWVSTDGGDDWSVAPGSTPVSTGIIEHVAVSPDHASDRTLLVSVRGEGLHRSVDSGGSWQEVGLDLAARGVQLREIVFSPTFATDDMLFGASLSSLLRSTDRGLSWEAADIGVVRYEENRQGFLASPFTTVGDCAILAADDASTGKYLRCEQGGDEVRFFFVGSGVRWLGLRGPDLGVVQMWVDGGYVTTIDQYEPELRFDVVQYALQGLEWGEHEVRLVATGDADPGSAGVALAVDAFDVFP